MDTPYQMYFLYCNSFPIWSQRLLCRFWYFPPNNDQNCSMSQEINTRQVSSKYLAGFAISISRAGIPSAMLFSKDTPGETARASMSMSSGTADKIMLLRRKRINLLSPLKQHTSHLASRRLVEMSLVPSYKQIRRTWEALLSPALGQAHISLSY